MKNRIYIIVIALIVAGALLAQTSPDTADTMRGKRKGETAVPSRGAPAPSVARSEGSADKDAPETVEEKSLNINSIMQGIFGGSESKGAKRESAKPAPAQSKSAPKESIEKNGNPDYDYFRDENNNGIDDRREKTKTPSSSTSSKRTAKTRRTE